jgi:hypothetical protein
VVACYLVSGADDFLIEAAVLSHGPLPLGHWK